MRDAATGREVDEVGHDAVENRFIVGHQIDLVDGQHHALQAEHPADGGVTLGLAQHALAGIDQNDGKLGRRCAGHHVAGVLLMTGRVGDDEGAARGRKLAIGDIDGDALLALGLESAAQQREIDVAGGGAVPARVTGERCRLVVGNLTGFEQQSAQQRRLAVVDRAAHEKTE